MKSGGHGMARWVAALLAVSAAAQLWGCSGSRCYVTPAADWQPPERLGVLSLSGAGEVSIDGMTIQQCDRIHVIPAWHYFESTLSRDKGCRRWQTTHYVTRIGRLPVRTDRRCLERRIEHVSFCGWYEVKAGDRLQWSRISGQLKVSKDQRDVIDELTDEYRRGDPRVRRGVVDRLREYRNVRGINVLMKALEDADPAVQVSACNALGAVDFDFSVGALRRLRDTTENASVREAAGKALGNLTGN